MKTLVFLALTLLFSNSAFSQLTKDVTWFDVSFKTGFGISILKNLNIQNDPNVSMETFNPSQFAGIKIGTTTAEKYGVYLESDYNSFSQRYNVLPTTQPQFVENYSMQSIDNALVFRYIHYSGAYIEAGVRYSLFLGAQASYSGGIIDEVDKKADYKTNFVSITGGLGMKIYQSTKDRYRISLFTRFAYGLTDIMKDPSLNPVKSNHYAILYPSTSKTSPFFLQLGFEFNYFAGYHVALGTQKNNFGANSWHFGD